MAFFKFRKSGDEPAVTPVPPESVEVIRRRAKHRLLGAVVLVLIGVVGFPLLFDKQPRPIAVDMPIDIPDRNKVKPLAIPAPLPASAAIAVDKVELATPPAAASVVAAPAPAPAPSSAPKAAEKQPEPKGAPAPAAKPDEAAKVQALLEGREPEKSVKKEAGRYVVQIGAFADAARAQEARLKVERAGLKTYTQVAETKDGRRTRVRVGPFADKAEADKAAEQIKKLGLPAGLLKL